MDSSIKATRESSSHQVLALPDVWNPNQWSNATSLGSLPNSKLVFISVEYNKETNEYKFGPAANFQEDTPTVDLVQHVSHLDPNMSSVACYSPTTSQEDEPDISYNTAIVENLLSAGSGEQLITSNADTFVDHLTLPNTSTQSITSTLSDCDPNILKEVTNNKHLLNADGFSSEVLQVVSSTEIEREVELLITDQVTGISYNISTQEYLVGRCLAEEQLLDAIAPGHFLDSDLLSIEPSLKSELAELEPVQSTEGLQVQNVDLFNSANTSEAQTAIKTEKCEDDENYNGHNLRRSHRRMGIVNLDQEEQLLSDVKMISDKPIETRAKASLPAPYLAIVKHENDQYGIIARKMIPKCTQFGPIEGLLVLNEQEKYDDSFQLLIDWGTGSIYRMDVSDESNSNWMCFVRKANTYAEQNLIVTQIGNSLFYITTVNILPKQELMVGYSAKYAKKYNLSFLKPLPDKNNIWHCFECYRQFPSSAELQDHLNVHDGSEKNGKMKKTALKKKKFKKEYKKYLVQCKLCLEMLSFSLKDYEILKKHSEKHKDENNSASVEDDFTVISYNCEKCGISFESEILLDIHHLQHKINNNTVLTTLICPKCERRFEVQSQLIEHVNHHCRDKLAPIISYRGYKCPICYKIFASDERIQRHMTVHGSEDSKPLKCDTCNKRFITNAALTCHLKSHIVQRNFDCPICKERFNQVVQLKLHVSQHCVDGKYTCPHCKKTFKEYCIIRKHIRAFHCEYKHICTYCSKSFPTLDKLRMHLLRHSDHKEFLCADCGKQFKRKDKLKEHAKRIHSEKIETAMFKPVKGGFCSRKFTPRVLPTDYHRFIYKCHTCLVGFKRRGMLVNHLAKQHPDIKPESVPELNLPILRTTRDYYCQYCDKIYKSSSKRKAHILKNHPGQDLPLSNRKQGIYQDVSGLPNPTFSQTVGSITTPPQLCQWCHKQYASKAKLLQHQRKKHPDLVPFEPTKITAKAAKGSKKKQEVMEKTIDVATEELLSESAMVLKEEKHEEYYQIISAPSSNTTTTTNSYNTVEVDDVCLGSDSRLYLLLTGNGMVQPPR